MPDSMEVRSVVEALRRPEYTGENRCLPCTVLNLAIVAAVAAVLGSALTPAAGLAAAGVGLALVYARGYVLPGTPTLTERLLPTPLLAFFEHGNPEPRPGSATTAADLDPEAALVEAGALRACADRDDLCLDPSFRSKWRSEMVVAAQNPDAAADRLPPEVFEESLHVEFQGEAAVARADGLTAAQWPSREAFVADAAGAAVLETSDPAWDERGFVERTQLLAGLRLWLGRCSGCDGRVELGEETVESCCRSVPVVAASCSTCGARIFEAPRPDE
jgi:hypothetical protein